VPKIIDPVFAKTSQNARFLLSENERFGLVFVKTGSINSGTGQVVRSSGQAAWTVQHIQNHILLVTIIQLARWAAVSSQPSSLRPHWL
jgi:hypothetical protein